MNLNVIIMKKRTTLLALLLAGSSMATFAQGNEQKDEFVPQWNLQIQGGAAYTLGEIPFKEMISPAAALYGGYRFTPLWGLRVGVSGWQAKGSWVNPQYDYKFNYIQGNIDAILDLGNLCGGYKPGRIVNPYLFAGVGLNGAFNNDEAVDWNNKGYALQYLWDDSKFFAAGRFGLGADFRLARNLSFNLEANANVLSDKFNSKKAGNVDWQFNLMAGFTIKFGGKKKAEPVKEEKVIPATPVTPAEPKEEPKVVKEEPKVVKVEPMTENVFFKINSAEINSEGMNKINQIVEFMNKNPKTKVNVCGYADKKTGSKSYNEKLSKKRAEAVGKVLVEKGISKDRVITSYKGDTVQPFSTNAENRVAICITSE